MLYSFWLLASGFWQSIHEGVIADLIRNLLKIKELPKAKGQ
jgi:hypothetical protein